MNKRKGQACLEPAREIDPEESGNWLAYFREKKQHLRPLAPRLSRRPYGAAYGLGPSVFTMRAKEVGHGSRLGFPGRRPPWGPAAFANVARDLQVLRNKASPVSSGGRGELGLDPAEPGLRPAGVPPPERSAGGGGHPDATRFARRGSTRFHPTDPWNCSAGEDPLPEPSRTELPEGPKVLF